MDHWVQHRNAKAFAHLTITNWHICRSFEFLEGSANLAKDFVTRKKFVAVGVPRISTQLGIESESPEDKESRDDLT